MASIHDLPKDVPQISPRNLIILGKVVIKNISADQKITTTEVVHSRPSLLAEFLSS